MTLDVPPPYPNGYPVIDPNKSEYKVGDLIYKAWIKFNSSEYYEWNSTSSAKIGEAMFSRYVKFSKKDKHKKKKVKKIIESHKAWIKANVKPT